MNKDEALEIALDYIRRTSHWEKGRDRHDTLKAVEAALAQPWPDLTKRDRESYQKGHNDGVAHHKQSVKAAQPAQEPVAWRWENAGEDKWLNKYIYFDNGAPDYPEECEPLYTTPPQRPWVGLTDEDCKGMSAGDKVVAMWANRILKERNS